MVGALSLPKEKYPSSLVEGPSHVIFTTRHPHPMLSTPNALALRITSLYACHLFTHSLVYEFLIHVPPITLCPQVVSLTSVGPSLTSRATTLSTVEASFPMQPTTT
jgi:hypothetical protein